MSGWADLNPWGKQDSKTSWETEVAGKGWEPPLPEKRMSLEAQNAAPYNAETHNIVLLVQECQEGLLNTIQRAEKARSAHAKQALENSMLYEYLVNMQSATDK